MAAQHEVLTPILVMKTELAQKSLPQSQVLAPTQAKAAYLAMEALETTLAQGWQEPLAEQVAQAQTDAVVVAVAVAAVVVQGLLRVAQVAQVVLAGLGATES